MKKINQIANIKRYENVRITVRDLEGEITEVKEIRNLIPTVDLNMIRDAYYGDVSDCEIKYMAIGDDNTAPALTDTTLGNETFRKILTSHSKPANGQILTSVYVAPAEAVGAIKEIGWFSGATAGAGADTGILSARVLYSRNKTALESLQVERTLTIAEG